MILTCCQCGARRTVGSARRCRACYLKNATERHYASWFGRVLTTLLDMERRGIVECVRGRWQLTPYHRKHPEAIA